ncbi:putative membrane-associated kinase regulator [Trema orientale]|uniref:Putative membrane-associated kinase regulator n=1 Tax=Trema orientale TaxID=63057 RepID=A0A2P5FXE5_TREOI|nr:putative membrane-associated kinase regulator [Trema orientale]
MATTIKSSHLIDEDYIDMEISSSPSSSSFFRYSVSSPPQSKEFEFQMSSVFDQERETTTYFPADELFYKGKLLPLHLPPRLQMVQKILQSSKTTTSTDGSEEAFEENFTIPFIATSSTAPCTNTNTPLESCNISPSESCRVSCELNPDEYLSEWATEVSVFIGGGRPKIKSWSWKLKQSSLGRKLKASRAYLKSLFNKPANSEGSCAKATCNIKAELMNASGSKDKDYLDKSIKNAAKNGRYQQISSLMKSIENEIMAEAGVSNSHRKSFSGVIQRHSGTKSLSTSTSSSGSSSSSSSFSLSSNGCYDLQSLKRSSSANSELESSIEGAIAHCKQSSQQLFGTSRSKTANQDGAFSLSTTRIAV